MMGDDVEVLAHIETHETMGKMLVATQTLAAGQVVINEKPLILVPSRRAIPAPSILLRECRRFRVYGKGFRVKGLRSTCMECTSGPTWA